MLLSWMSVEVAAAITSIIVIIYVYFTWNYNYWKKRGVHHEKPKLFFGNYKPVFMVQKTVGNLMEDIYWKNEDQPYVGIFRFRSPALLLRDPDLIKKILVNDFASFHENALLITKELDPLLAKSPFFSKGEQWRETRTILSPSFTSGRLKPLFPLMKEVAEEMVDYIKNNAAFGRPDGIEVKELATKFTTDVVASCAFGIKGGSFKNPNAEMLKMGKSILEADFIKNIKFLITFICPSLGALLRIRLMPVDTAKFYYRIIREVVEFREKNKINRNDYLHQLISLKHSTGGNAFTDEDVTAHAVTFMTEGFETSSITLSFLLYELAMNPDIQERLREELETSVKENGGTLNPDGILALPYLSMVLQETLRMHPPVLTLEKFCTQPYRMQNSSGRSFTLDPGTLVLIPAQALHRDPKYFPDPHIFDPDRFSEERKDYINRFAYLPFGEGPRICIGMRFAQAQVKMGTALLVLNYDIQRTYKTPATIVQDPNYFMAAAKGGLWLNFVKRT
ncbi:cytochrome P450 6j1 [Anabrus simplex]|uniref:cytochrome P450 6j1 n=1 Tax=Anabrus simplex TaxID=316456 RepID=UPI0035A2CB19